MSKYIDLAEKVIGGPRVVSTTGFRVGVSSALKWLDDHPDQVPGRTITITERDFDVLVDATFGRIHKHNARTFAETLRIKVVPNPEPTEAEKLEKLILEYERGTENMKENGLTLAEFLAVNLVYVKGD